MSITINGTTGIAGVDGSATTPAFQGTDTNTGLFYGTDIVGIATGGSERVRVDSSGNVGIGTSSPDALLTVNTIASFGDGAVATPSIAHKGDLNTGIFFPAADTIAATTGGTERMRIDSSGTLLVGQTGNPATGSVVIKIPNPTGNGVNAQMASNTGTAYPWSNYNASGTYIGGMTSTSSSTGFPTSSDKRLKKNIEDAPSAIDKILNTQVVSHDWINDEAHVEYGFIAQDLQKIIPQAVMEGNDKEDGSINMPWGVDYSKIVPLLTKAIQELSAKVDAQQQEINALKEAKVV